MRIVLLVVGVVLANFASRIRRHWDDCSEQGKGTMKGGTPTGCAATVIGAMLQL